MMIKCIFLLSLGLVSSAVATCACNGQDASCSPHCPCQTETGYCVPWDNAKKLTCDWKHQHHAESGCASDDTKFDDFVKAHGKRFKDDADKFTRKKTFIATLARINHHNTKKNTTFKMGLNEFSDWTAAQMASMRGYKPPTNHTPNYEPGTSHARRMSLASSVDWTTYDPPVLTPIKNQGQCGSCWTFAATECTESAYAISNPGSSPPVLSEEQIVQCYGSDGDVDTCSAGGGPDGEQGCGGCAGGYSTDAFSYIQSNGLTTEADYPYVSGTTGNNPIVACSAFTPQYTITNYYDVTAQSTADLMQAVSNQPVAVAIDASSTSFNSYTSGIFSDCGTTLDHAVQLVGYGSEDGTDYWLVRNSWGTTWGEDGYIKILRTNENGVGTCGIMTSPSYAVGGKTWSGTSTETSPVPSPEDDDYWLSATRDNAAQSSGVNKDSEGGQSNVALYAVGTAGCVVVAAVAAAAMVIYRRRSRDATDHMQIRTDLELSSL